MTSKEKILLADELALYCKRFNVPIQFLFQILGDQKVTPMIRGKAMEYNAYLLLGEILPKKDWDIQKLNLNAQAGGYGDEDVSITHLRTRTVLRVECKSCVRGSIKDGTTTRNIKEPHFRVKCHKSRSNLKKASTSNDRYSINDFDIIITNPSNAIYQGKTISEELEIIHDESLRQMLYNFYNVSTDEGLLLEAENDWRFCIPADIAISGFIPRNPYVVLTNDHDWRPINELEKRILEIVTEQYKIKRHK